MREYFGTNASPRFLFPIDGDCVNQYDGKALPHGLRIPVTVEAPKDHRLTVNGTPARFENGIFRAYADLLPGETELCAEDLTDGTKAVIRVLYLPNATGGYRLSSDDNIIFLQDINDHKDVYSSIFENPYLAMYRQAHERFGAQVHLNLFYEFDDEARSYFSKPRPYFNLSMMTDKFKEEFRANADWLKLSFHAKSEMPPAPYRYANGETVRRDCEQVHREIIRFAGEESLSTCTTVHFGEANEDGVRALRALGYRAMTGYFIPAKYPVAYYAPEALISHIHGRDFWYDTDVDVLFGRIDLVLNSNTPAENLQTLCEVMASPTRGGFVSVMIHEQYFYEDYRNYLPDFEARVLEACELIAANGYVGRHIIEAIRH